MTDSRRQIRVLHVEDSPQDVALLQRHLTAAGYELVSDRVDTRSGMEAALAACEWDLILCDYSMPTFNALRALEVLQESRLDIPLIIISGTVGEEIAVEAMLRGATDYIPKDNLLRLTPAIERALGEAKNRRRQRQADTERKVIFDIMQGVVTADHLGDFLRLVHRSISQVVYARNCFVMLHDPATGLNRFEFWVDKCDPPPAPKPVDRGFENYVLRSGEPLLLDGDRKQRMLAEGLAERVGSAAESWLGVPLRTPKATIGVLVIQDYENKYAYSEQDVDFLLTIGDQIALAIERKRAADALSESERRYRDLVENAIDIIYTHDLEGNYTSVNRAAEAITGYTRDEALRMNVDQTVAPEFREKARRMIEDKLAGKEVTAYELEIVAKDGRRITVEVNTRIIYQNNEPVGVQGIARDVTERRQLEEQFRQAQKMEAVGLLAGGIAHDFNNLLTAITGYSDLTLRQLPADATLRRNIEEVKNAADRAAGLTGQLLAFSRKQVLKIRVHNVNSVISNIERMLRRIIRESVELKTTLAPDLGNVRSDPGQVEQVIMNLAINARDAMPNGGELSIETSNVEIGQHNERGLAPGPYILIKVTDTGHGMDDATRQRIFEPFFTTKEIGKGSGLGLSTAHGIVKQSGGDIAVTSRPGAGTTFEIFLPRVDEKIEVPKWTEHAPAADVGSETILIVEDDEIVRGLIREILSGSGYTLLEAAEPSTALAISEKHPGNIDLLLSDVVMPGMSGPTLAKELLKTRPDTKVLLMSGYTDDSLTESGVYEEDMILIEKPFSPDSLARRIRELLDEK